jgi:hypothetical protein
MTTAIEESELSTELQELYMVTKQWLSELTFLENELEFFRKRFKNLPDPIDVTTDFVKITNIEKTHNDLRNHILHYSHRLEPLILEKKQIFDMNLIETYAQIKMEMERFTGEIQSVKNEALAVTKEIKANNKV